MSLLAVDELTIEFDTADGRRTVVDSVSFALEEGEVLGILGESGSGKTITTSAILGLIQGYPGVVRGRALLNFEGQEINLFEGLDEVVRPRKGRLEKNIGVWDKRTARRMKRLWGSGLTAIFQNPRASLDPLVTIGKQVEKSAQLAQPSRSKSQARGVALEWLERVKLPDPARVFRSYAHELSGGMCQRAMIAVALAREPKLLIADEPTTGLDTTVRAGIVELFAELIGQHRRSMLYISHDVREVLFLSDRIMVMKDGRVLEISRAADIRAGRGQRAEYTQFLLDAANIRVERASHDA